MRDRDTYRPDVDGLRALAVVAVIINHFSTRVLPSGYLGVDIFFVISGFVITGSLTKTPATSFVDFIAGFYTRRIKRLMPALVVCVAVTALLTSAFDPMPTASLDTGVYALFGGSNVWLYSTATNYFAEPTAFNTFVHTWSLGVEEQFYLVFPLLLWLTKRWLLAVLAVLGICSLVAFVVFNRSNEPLAYYLMPTRFWELAAGCALFVWSRHARPLVDRGGVGSLVVLLLLVATLALPAELEIEATIATVVLTAALIALSRPDAIAYRLLAHRTAVFVGTVSYSLYLWHWPVLSLSRLTIGIHGWTIPLQAALMLALALASYRLVERPLRRATWARSRALSIAMGIAVVAAAALLLNGSRETLARLYLGDYHHENALLSDNHTGLPVAACMASNPDAHGCFLPSRTGQRLVAIGDSHTGHLVPLFSKLWIDTGIGVGIFYEPGEAFPGIRHTRSRAGTPLLTLAKYDRVKVMLDKFADSQLASLHPGDLVVLSSRFDVFWTAAPIPKRQRTMQFTYYDDADHEIAKPVALAAWEASLDRFCKEAAKRELAVVLFTPVPTWEDVLAPSATQPAWFNELSDAVPHLDRSYLLDQYKELDLALQRVRAHNANVYLFDAFEAVCPTGARDCTPVRDGVPYYHDEFHFSPEGSNAVERAFLDYLRANHLVLSWKQ